jgi:hypothetical protein
MRGIDGEQKFRLCWFGNLSPGFAHSTFMSMLLRAPPDEENALRRAGAGTGLAGLPRPAVAPRGRSADQILVDAGARPI